MLPDESLAMVKAVDEPYAKFICGVDVEVKVKTPALLIENKVLPKPLNATILPVPV